MGPIWFRVAVAGFFVLGWCVPFYVDAATVDDGFFDDADGLVWAAFFAFLVVLTLATGFIVRWPALALPIVVYLALTPLGVHPEDSDGWTYAALYAIPTGFLSFFVLALSSMGGIAWRRRRGSGDSAPPEPDEGGSDARSLLLVVLSLAIPTGIFALVIVSLTDWNDVKEPLVRIENPNLNAPKPGDTTLHLIAADVESCSSEDDKVVDLNTEETANQITIGASLEVHGSFPCESRFARVPFVVTLEQPLGERTVIDDSRGAQRVVGRPTRPN
jgi:hypothetical protein